MENETLIKKDEITKIVKQIYWELRDQEFLMEMYVKGEDLHEAVENIYWELRDQEKAMKR